MTGKVGKRNWKSILKTVETERKKWKCVDFLKAFFK